MLNVSSITWSASAARLLVIAFDERHREDDVVAPVLVDDRAPSAIAASPSMHRRQQLPLDRDQLQQRVGVVARRGDHRGDRLALVDDLVEREHTHVVVLAPEHRRRR